MTEHYTRVRKFMELAKQETPVGPVIPSEQVRLLRARLIIEEAMETVRALGVDIGVSYKSLSRDHLPITKATIRFKMNPTRGCDFIEVLDGCADVSVVTIGTLVAFGMPDGKLLEMVDESNLAKFTGDAHADPETNKWIKPSDWVKPDLEALATNQVSTVLGRTITTQELWDILERVSTGQTTYEQEMSRSTSLPEFNRTNFPDAT